MTTATKESVVTPERFKSGMTWNQYLAFINSEENFQRLTPGGSTSGRRERGTLHPQYERLADLGRGP